MITTEEFNRLVAKGLDLQIPKLWFGKVKLTAPKDDGCWNEIPIKAKKRKRLFAFQPSLNR